MFEHYFGLRTAPFQLSPDPDFYFESRGHRQALAYLQFGVHQGEGFIVVTGEIGAGKSTVVRTLLKSLDPDRVVAAQILNTQLDENQLLVSICHAFGIASPGNAKAQLLASLEAFFTVVAAGGRRALLVVDEAQNLGHREIEELRMLSNFQLENRALLQSFLVGQPELRAMIGSPAMEQLRQRVIAACHLGPLSAEETRGYIDHRMRFAGCNGAPIFDDEAVAQIFAFTGGVPRRINLLCTRLLLAAFLGSEERVVAARVQTVVNELDEESGRVSAAVTS
ncbi:MAG: AAA family ATPase [Ramlibacter sp.]|nr:AAA family ATPase [Ramlibacter sp.]